MKKIKDLIPGETFLDSLGMKITVVSIKELPWNQIPRTSPQVRLIFKTYSGREMFQNFKADKMVEIVK